MRLIKKCMSKIRHRQRPLLPVMRCSKQTVSKNQMLIKFYFQLTFSPVVSFLHRKPHERALFYQIEAENGAIFKLTGKHFIYVTDCNSVNYRRIYADQAEIGQCLPWVDNEESRLKPTPIVNITQVWQTGIYAPLTGTGVGLVYIIAG